MAAKPKEYGEQEVQERVDGAELLQAALAAGEDPDDSDLEGLLGDMGEDGRCAWRRGGGAPGVGGRGGGGEVMRRRSCLAARPLPSPCPPMPTSCLLLMDRPLFACPPPHSDSGSGWETDNSGEEEGNGE
jgi:hypothetical protein